MGTVSLLSPSCPKSLACIWSSIPEALSKHCKGSSEPSMYPSKLGTLHSKCCKFPVALIVVHSFLVNAFSGLYMGSLDD